MSMLVIPIFFCIPRRLLMRFAFILFLLLSVSTALAQTTCAQTTFTQTTFAQTESQESDPPNFNAVETVKGVATGSSPTDDSASQESTAWESLIFKLRQGGITVVLQILLSIFGFAVALERFFNLRSKSLVPQGLIVEADRLWQQGEYDQLIQTARKDGSLLGQVIEEVVRHRSAGYQVTSQIAGDVAAREIRRHTQRLFPIALVATLEPLLGLLGTMLGMIGAFETVAVAGSMGDASILADDIAKALVTTAVGLIIAIPAVFIYHYLKSQIGFGSASLDQAASGLINDWMLLGPNNSATGTTNDTVKVSAQASSPAAKKAVEEKK